MLRIITSTCLACLIIAFAGCQKTKQMAAAPDGVTASEVEIGDHQTIAVLDFNSDPRDEITPRATQAFLKSFRASHPNARIIELGPEHQLLSAVGHRSLNQYALEEIHRRFGFDAVLAGELEVERIWPAGLVTTWEELHKMCANARLEATLHARLLDTATGTTIWTASAQHATPFTTAVPDDFDPTAETASDVNDPYETLILALVQQITGDGAAIDEPTVRTAVVEP